MVSTLLRFSQEISEKDYQETWGTCSVFLISTDRGHSGGAAPGSLSGGTVPWGNRGPGLRQTGLGLAAFAATEEGTPEYPGRTVRFLLAQRSERWSPKPVVSGSNPEQDA